MLQIKNIKKQYKTGDLIQNALDDVSLTLRDNEFVAILGPSGSGKTTLLNIIGGLDRYDSGNLIINGISTAEYKDRDWDSYRNHTIGFVFQSYNLIPHQTILANVEIALTISGISKQERKERARNALEQVGLGDHIHKKPNQLSGGQMQRVAIARALVNNPDILLADEPTGALDTETSVQVMELLKEVAKDRLVVMVTHNPELAEEYATRIVNLKDGHITGDTDPYEIKEEEQKVPEHKNMGKSSMSLWTSLALSFNNLKSKLARTLLTAFAGSIGIIGIALILALSSGVNTYINNMQRSTMASYPITIEASSLDMTTILSSIMNGLDNDKTQAKDGTIESSSIMTDIIQSVIGKRTNNNLKEFMAYLESDDCEIKNYTNAIKYSYGLDLNIYNENGFDGVVKVNPSNIFEGTAIEQMFAMSSIGSSSMMSSEVWTELLDNQTLLDKEYDLVTGQWPTAYNEIVLEVNEYNKISDYTLYSLGLMDKTVLKNNINAALFGGEPSSIETKQYTYDEILNMTFKLVLNSDYYKFDEELGIWVERTDEEMKEFAKNYGTELKIVGIIKASPDSVNSQSYGGVCYTSALQTYLINKINESEIVKAQNENSTIDIFTGLEFGSEGCVNTFKSNLSTLGSVDLENPSSISIYAKDFDSKEEIARLIEEYNSREKAAGREENVLTYSDLVGTLMSSVTSIVNIISYVLIAFVSVSLIVSSIMIGVITLISVMERTKEIGILRAMGASKRNISQIFNAETFIIGLTSGVLGIFVALVLTLPINAIIHVLTGSATVNASLPIVGALVLIAISVILSLIAGFIPARKAAKKDPVTALRTE